MRLKLLTWYDKLVLFILSALGVFSSCDENPFNPPGCEYGTPWARYKVSGKVEDKLTGKGIEHIGVFFKKEPWDTVYTNADGEYAIEAQLFPISDSVPVTFYDTDSLTNGAYVRKDTTLYFDAGKLTGGDDSWYDGETSSQCDINLDKYKK